MLPAERHHGRFQRGSAERDQHPVADGNDRLERRWYAIGECLADVAGNEDVGIEKRRFSG